MDLSRVSLLRERDFFVAGFSSDGWVPFRVVRRKIVTFQYSFARDISGFNGAAAGTWTSLLGGASELPTLAAAPANSQVTNQYLNFQAVGNNVTDALNPAKDYEVLQAYYGIAPSVLRVFLLQPNSQYVSPMDWQMIPLSLGGELINIGYLDGFLSPYNSPDPATEFFTFKNVEPSFSLANPVPEQINPRLQFILNRMVVAPVTDPQLIRGLFAGSIPSKFISVGEPFSPVEFPGGSYGGVSPLPADLGDPSYTMAQVRQVLQDSGYLTSESNPTPATRGGA